MKLILAAGLILITTGVNATEIVSSRGITQNGGIYHSKTISNGRVSETVSVIRGPNATCRYVTRKVKQFDRIVETKTKECV